MHAVSAHLLVDTASTALIASIWQGTLLVAAIALCMRVIRGLSASARSAVWTVVLLLVLALPLFSLVHPQAISVSTGTLQLRETWSMVFFGIWLLLSAFRALALLRGALALCRIAANAVTVVPEASIAALLHRTRRRRRSVALCLSTDIQRPCVAGFLHPRILLPATLLPALSASELEQIVLHELEHLRRRDDWINLLQQAALVLFPLNPAVVWLDRRLASERELACDDEVLRATGARKVYASCLARVAEHALFTQGVTLALALLGRPHREPELTARVQRILRRPEASIGNTQLRVSLGLVITAAFVAFGLISHTPQLVSFAPAAVATQTAAATPPALAAAPYRASSIRPTLVGAVLASPHERPRHGMYTATSRRNHRPAPNLALSDASWLIAAQPRPSHHPVRKVLASLEDSQPAYAAFRFADGWLIVQL